MGTHCFFTDSKKLGGGEDACFNEMPAKMYDYYAKTNKVLKMKRIFVEENETEPNSDMAESDIEDLAHLRITKTYADALNQFLKAGEQPPREIIQNSDDENADDENANEENANEENADEENVDKENANEGNANDADTEMEVDPSVEEPSGEDPSEDSVTTNVIKQALQEADARDEVERLNEPDYEPS